MGPGAVATNGNSGGEVAPTKVRTLVQALTVARGRLRPAISPFVFPLPFKTYGEAFAIHFYAAGRVRIAVVTWSGCRKPEGLVWKTHLTNRCMEWTFRHQRKSR